MIDYPLLITFLLFIIIVQQALWNIDKYRSIRRRSKEITELKAKNLEILAQQQILMQAVQMIEPKQTNIISKN